MEVAIRTMTRFQETLPTAIRIGLLGGSFDPAHDGHRHATLWALRRFRLDLVLWLVSPGNPMKLHPSRDFAARVQKAREIARHPRIVVSTLEARSSLTYTVDTISLLRQSFPSCRFLWLMGSDNLCDFHRWHAWQTLAGRVGIGVLARPPSRMMACNSAAARALAPYRLHPAAAPKLIDCPPPAWTLVNIPLNPTSSSALRAEACLRCPS